MNQPGPKPLRTATGSRVTSTGSPPKPPSPPIVPDHELLQPIGHGSYGEVWLGRNKLGTLRAIKIVYRATFEDERPFQREYQGIQKFEPVSRSHEGLVDILQVGGTEDCFYYVMELADSVGAVQRSKFEVHSSSSVVRTGAAREHEPTSNLEPETLNHATYVARTLRCDIKRRGALPPEECVAIGLALSDALMYLHSRGLVHRDIKPSNIVFVDGAPKLADIGLVTDVDATRSYVGTEGFMPPEGPGTPQADIYSLGKVLYEMCTGKSRQEFPDLPTEMRPGSTSFNAAPATASHEPRLSRPSATLSSPLEGEEREGRGVVAEIRGTIPEPRALPITPADHRALLELNEIFTKACEADPRKRYQSAREMRGELELLQHCQSVKARRTTQRRFVLLKRIGFITASIGLLAGLIWPFSNKLTWRKPGSAEHQATPDQQQKARRLFQEAKKLYINTQDGLAKAIDLYNRAIDQDPSYAEAYADLALCYSEAQGVLLACKHALGEAKYNALRALQLHQALPTAHIALARVFSVYEWNPTNAEFHYRRAIELAPRDGRTYGDAAGFLASVGRFPEAEQLLKQGEQVDPKEHNLHAGWCWYHFFRRDFNAMLQSASRLLTLHSNSIVVPMFQAYAHERLGHYDQALPLAQKIAQLDPAPDFIAFLGMVHGRMGHDKEAQVALEELRVMSQTPGRIMPTYFAQVYLGLGDRARATEHLQRAVKEFPPHAEFLKYHPLWDDLRPEPGFQALLKQVRLEK